MIMEEMSVANNLFMWIEFLLDKQRLKQHLAQEHPEPHPTTLLIQFVINADRAIHLSNGGNGSGANGGSSTSSATTTNNTGSNHTPTPPPSSSENSEDGTSQPMTAETLASACRAKKTRSLIMMALQVAAHLGWDLDILAGVPIVLQHSLMKHMMSLVNAELDKGNKASERSKEFLRVLYHRWVLRTLNNYNSLSRTQRMNNVTIPGTEHFNTPFTIETVVKQLSEDESSFYLKNFFSNQSIFAKIKDFRVPNFETFASDKDPDWQVGTIMSRAAFESLIHFELSVYWLYKGTVTEASYHFKSQKSKPEQYAPYLKISASKMEGYKKALGQVATAKSEDGIYKIPTLNYSSVAELAKAMRKGQVGRLKKFLTCPDDIGEPPRKLEKLAIDKMENYEGSLLSTGDDKLAMSVFEAKLIETSDVNMMKDCLTNLGRLTGGNASAGTLYSKLFSGWELPIPVHHAILNIPAGPFLDFIYVLVAKSRQLLVINMFKEAREMLVAASLELGAKLKQSLRSGRGVVDPFTYNVSKITKMLEWEILLIDINQFYMEYDPKKPCDTLMRRCKDCLEFLRDQNNEINPRSEIVENILMALINVGEYHFVVHYDKTQQQRYPFLDFLTLLARVCQELFIERKDTSSNYRELWSAVLPLFSSYNSITGSVMVGSAMSANSKKIGSSSLASTKPAILSSRHLLLWVIDRSCSQNLISVWVSLLARLHNHILDDVGLQILTEYLHIWPNILDDVTAGLASAQENKVNRVAGSSKLNSRHIRDFLFHILGKALMSTAGSDIVCWLRCLGDVNLAAGVPASAMKCYVEYLAIGTEFFEKHNSSFWSDNNLFKRMIKCCEMMGAHTQAVILCQFLTEVDYSMAFGKAQEKITSDASDALYGFIWDLTILEFLINLHSKRNETSKRLEAVKVMGLLELNSNNNEEIQRESMYLRKSQFMRTLAKQYVFL